MLFASILTIFVCCFNHVLSRHIIEPKQEKSHHKLNVVLFFANSDDSCPISKDSPAVKCLGINEIARVKHSIPTSHENAHNADMIQRSEPDCECTKLLKDGLASLTHFCQNALGMKTAIVSVSSLTRDISEYQESPEDMPQRQIPNPENFFRYDVIPTQGKTNHQPGPSKMDTPVIAKSIITSPEHVEVFNIRVKRQLNEEAKCPGEIISIPLERETDNNKNPFGMMNFLGQIKYSFFGKLFEDPAKTKLKEEENSIPSEINLNNQDPGLFESVKSTLVGLQEAPGEFLMVVFGGHLAELNNRHSPLVQSVKHVMESTDPENTLVVLTGTCGHKAANADEVAITEKTTIRESDHSEYVPIFAKGPKCEKLQECMELYEVPQVVKSILAECSPNFEGAILSARQKRNLLYGLPPSRKLYENHAWSIHVNDKFYTVIFYFVVSLLFIL